MALAPEETERLRHLEEMFEAAGGRGVDLAEEIDALHAKRDGNEPKRMRVTVRRVEVTEYEASTAEFPDVDFEQVDMETFARANYGTFDETSSSYETEEVVDVTIDDAN